MQTGKSSKTRLGDREVISVSLPIPVYDQLQDICEHFNLNRSSFIASAITDYMLKLGVKVGEK